MRGKRFAKKFLQELRIFRGSGCGVEEKRVRREKKCIEFQCKVGRVRKVAWIQ